MESRIVKILAIDDNPDNLVTIQALVNESYPDMVVLKALTGVQGLKLAIDEIPDVILLDIIMPGMDGFEVCQRLKADKKLRDIPVIFVTAIKGDKESRIKALEYGAEAFLAKPIDESELTAQIRAMVKIRTAFLERHDETIRLAALVAERTLELKKTHSATLNLLEDLKNENEARKRTEESLRESEEKFRDMANLLPQIVFEIDISGNITYVNKQAYSIFGYDINELIGLNSLIFHIPEERDMIKENILLKLAGKEVERKEYNMVRKNGFVFPSLIYTSQVFNANKIVGLRGIVIDITEQKLAEEKISHVARLYAFLSQIDQAIVRTQSLEELFKTICDVAVISGQFHMSWVGLFDDSDNRIKPISWAGHTDGYLDELIIMTGFEIYGKGPTGSAFREGKIIFCNDIATDPTMLPWRDAALRRGYKSLIAVPFHQKGKIIGTLTLYATEPGFFKEDELRLLKEIGDDISFAINAIDTENQRIKSERELEHSRNELKTIYDHAPVMMCVVDEKRNVLFANQSFSTLTGIPEKEMIGGAVGNVIGCINSMGVSQGCGLGPKCWNCTLRIAMEKTFNTGVGYRNIEYQAMLNTDGLNHEVSLLGSTAIIRNDDKNSLLLCLHDITDRKLAEDALQKSEMLLRTFIDNSPFDIWARDIDNVGILENKKFVDHYGSIIGRTPTSNVLISNKTMEHWLNINKRVLLTGDIIDEEYEFELRNEIRLFQQTVFPIKNNNKIIGIAGFNIDITDRKQVEEALSDSQDQLKKFAAHLQNVREEERVLLAREIHDELGQILIAIKIDMGMLKQNVLKGIDLKHSEQILTKFDGLFSLVDNTIKTARKIMTDLRPEVLDLLGFIETIKQLLKTFQERYKIKCIFDNSLASLQLDSQQSVALFRIIQEALNNVAKHSKATELRVKLAQNENKLTLEIVDNGIGFDENHKRKSDSYGLIGMKERVFLLDGELTILGRKDIGTTIKVVMPYIYLSC